MGLRSPVFRLPVRLLVLLLTAVAQAGAQIGAQTGAQIGAQPTAATLRADVQAISLPYLALGVLAIYLSNSLRAARWALLMPAEQRPPARILIPSQFIGFAAVALFGRVADLTRPYLIARRTATPIALQIAVYSLERAFDLAATAILFSLTLLFVPRSAPHHGAFARAGILASAATLFLLAFAVLIRSAGDRLASWTRRRFARLSPKLSANLANRLLELQAGFATLRSATHLLGTLAWSLVIWGLVALSYLLAAHSLPGTPQLAQLGPPAIMLLMATSMGASLLQLPVLGWFTQIAALAAAFHGFFGVPPRAASLCGFLTLGVNTFSVILPGLLLARRGGLSLRQARHAAAQPQAPAASVGSPSPHA